MERVAKALRTGRKSIPVHPVRVTYTKPTPTGKTRRKKKPAAYDHEEVMKALRRLKRAAYNGDVHAIPELEAQVDRLLGV